jgi:hypothetical protein
LLDRVAECEAPCPATAKQQQHHLNLGLALTSEPADVVAIKTERLAGYKAMELVPRLPVSYSEKKRFAGIGGIIKKRAMLSAVH